MEGLYSLHMRDFLPIRPIPGTQQAASTAARTGGHKPAAPVPPPGETPSQSSSSSLLVDVYAGCRGDGSIPALRLGWGCMDGHPVVPTGILGSCAWRPWGRAFRGSDLSSGSPYWTLLFYLSNYWQVSGCSYSLGGFILSETCIACLCLKPFDVI
jgi:hypothetical protein